MGERERLEMVMLYHRGVGVREIARRYGVSPATVVYWVKKLYITST